MSVCFNGQFTIEVSKDKVIDRSGYFESIVNPFFRDVKQKYVEVNFNVSNEIFKQVMSFVETGEITLDYEYLFKIAELSQYLQIDNLNKKCLDYFTYNLKKRNINILLSIIEKYPLLDKKFKDNAIGFKGGRRLAFGGLFFVEVNFNQLYLRQILDRFTEDSVLLKRYNLNHKISNCKIYYFCNSLIIYVQNGLSSDLIKYDLIRGDSKNIEIGNIQFPVVTSNSKNLFLIGVNKDAIQLSIFTVSNKELELNSEKLINSIKFIKQSHTMKLIFTHCYDDCLYIYYTFFESNTVVCEFEIHLMVVCIKTFNVLKNRKFFDDQTIADIDWNDYDERFSDIKIMSMT